MRVLMAMTAALVLAATAAGEAAAPKVSCRSGTTAFVEGKLRIFGVRFESPDEFGYDEWACFGRGAKPQGVGLQYDNTGTGSDRTPAYAIAGRFLAAYRYTDGEGGPSAYIDATDLRTRRRVNFVNVSCCEGIPAFRVTRDGTLVILAAGEDLIAKPPGRKPRTLSGSGVPKDLAMTGTTVYWTEDGQPRSAELAGAGVAATDRMLEPVRFRPRGGTCAAAHGRTIAASPSVRVYETGDGRFACRIGRPGRFALAGSTPPRIVADRWLLVFGEGSARVVDSRTGGVRSRAQGVSDATLLTDGTLAWLDFGGRLLAQRPGEQPIELAPASGAPSALAAARRVVYWTEGGEPRRYPTSAARSASKPG